jgi:hypothetical protein
MYAYSLQSPINGQVKITWQAVAAGSGSVNSQIYVNGVAKGSSHTATSSSPYFTETGIQANMGDRISIYGDISGSPSTAQAGNVSIYVDGYPLANVLV